MKLTKRKALTICRDLWQWLANQSEIKYPDTERLKRDWRGWDKNGGPIPTMRYFCPCCAFAIDSITDEPECKNCPLLKLWKGNGIDKPCLSSSSPYEKWFKSHGKAARKHATTIANACTKELRNL